MARHNIDKQVKRKLDEREIKPSDAAWNRLEAMLDDEQPRRKPMKWLFIAAGIAVVVALGSMVFRTDYVRQPAPAVVTAEPKGAVNDDAQKSPVPMVLPMPEKTQRAVAEQRHEAAREKLVAPAVSEPTLDIPTEIAVVVAPESVPSDPVPAVHQRKRITVNPDVLLSEVNRELDASFREKVIRSFGQSVHEVRVTLSNRNLEQQ